jgi:hypothetical protein
MSDGDSGNSLDGNRGELLQRIRPLCPNSKNKSKNKSKGKSKSKGRTSP